MSVADRVRHEVREIGLVTGYFLLWFLLFLTLKKLVLAEYQIHVSVVGTAVVGALVIAKIVVLLENTPIAAGFRSSLVVLNVLWRSGSYTAVVLAVLLAERLFHAYRAQDDLSAAVSEIWATRDVHHALAMAISIGMAFVIFNGSVEIDRRLGSGGLRRLFFSRRVADSELPADGVQEPDPRLPDGGAASGR